MRRREGRVWGAWGLLTLITIVIGASAKWDVVVAHWRGATVALVAIVRSMLHGVRPLSVMYRPNVVSRPRNDGHRPPGSPTSANKQEHDEDQDDHSNNDTSNHATEAPSPPSVVVLSIGLEGQRHDAEECEFNVSGHDDGGREME